MGYYSGSELFAETRVIECDFSWDITETTKISPFFWNYRVFQIGFIFVRTVVYYSFYKIIKFQLKLYKKCLTFETIEQN